MSRTMHHVTWKHWNVKATKLITVYRWGIGRVGLAYEDETLGNELHDLRFYAGCKRTPQPIHLIRWYTDYCTTWGHAGGLAKGYARKHRRRTRNEERAYGRDILKAYRAGEDPDEYTEPEGRTRHSALWEAL